MNVLLQRSVLSCLLLLAGCSTIGNTVDSVKNSVSGVFGGGDAQGNALTSVDKQNPSASTLPKYAATVRVVKYADQRKIANPRLLGEVTTHVGGMSGSELLIDQDVSDLATLAIKKRFDSEGFQVMEGSSANNALFEISGVIKELTLDIKERDQISIGIESTVKEVATGKVVWSGLVTEKNQRFAGVSGNNKEDVIAYLNQGMRVVTKKTIEAIGASLMATRPELFNLTPGTKPIQGVTVYVAPTAVAPVTNSPVALPAGATAASVPTPAYTPHASATEGLLLVNTNPQRAKVYLDGVYFGMSPLRLEMAPGVHAISVKLEGYKMVTEKVSVRKGDNTELELNLER
ncbi:MAG: PEGA domain-containing protein [Gallionella sp.]|nr:PEGA domain-containing protein [Gallionella sp.]MDD4960032.1 PEGA domain-containing protein [Gallionella sp.]